MAHSPIYTFNEQNLLFFKFVPIGRHYEQITMETYKNLTLFY